MYISSRLSERVFFVVDIIFVFDDYLVFIKVARFAMTERPFNFD